MGRKFKNRYGLRSCVLGRLLLRFHSVEWIVKPVDYIEGNSVRDIFFFDDAPFISVLRNDVILHTDKFDANSEFVFVLKEQISLFSRLDSTRHFVIVKMTSLK